MKVIESPKKETKVLYIRYCNEVFTKEYCTKSCTESLIRSRPGGSGIPIDPKRNVQYTKK